MSLVYYAGILVGIIGGLLLAAVALYVTCTLMEREGYKLVKPSEKRNEKEND